MIKNHSREREEQAVRIRVQAAKQIADHQIFTKKDFEKILAVIEASRNVIGLMCKYGNHASEGCHQCILAKALEALDK